MARRLARDRVESRLIERMNKAGLPLVDRGPFKSNPVGKILYPANELIFNRGLDPKRSSFCVIATKRNDGSVILHYYNADQWGTTLAQDGGIYRKIKLSPGSSSKKISRVVMRIKNDSRKKVDNEFFFSPHQHFGRLSPPFTDSRGRFVEPGMVGYDDGVSYLTANIRKAMLHHIDYYSLTSHNSFSKNKFDFMSWAGHYFGFMPVPGVELTGPLKPPNGPHFVAWMRNAKVAEQLRRTIMDKREHHDMPSFFIGMSMEAMLDVLFSFQELNLLALGIAHPVNFNSPTLPVPIVGLYTAVDSGALTLDEAHAYARRFDSVAMWNASLYTKAKEVRVKNDELREFLKKVNKKHVGNRRLWVNQTNYALAMELRERYGIHSHFETDEHKTLPLLPDGKGGYILGGDTLGMGTTVIEVPDEVMETLGRKPKVGELIDMIRSKTVNMFGKVFAVKREDGMTIHSERAKMPKELKARWRKYRNAVDRRYFGMIVRDLFERMSKGQFKQIRGMPGK